MKIKQKYPEDYQILLTIHTRNNIAFIFNVNIECHAGKQIETSNWVHQTFKDHSYT